MKHQQAQFSRFDLIRPAIRRMHGYVPGEQPREVHSYIKMNSNENPYPPSPRVLQALRHAVGQAGQVGPAFDDPDGHMDLRVYPSPTAEDLREKAATVYDLEPNQILIGNGSDDLLTMLMRTCVDPGDRVAYPVLTYSLYDILVAMQDGHAVHVPWPQDFSLPVQQLVESEAKLVFVANPNAPFGNFTPLDQLEALARQTRSIVVVDEAYVDFAEASALPLIHTYPHVLILRTFSKSFSLAGMRIGMAFGQPELLAELMKVKDSYNLNRLSIVAAIAALEDYDWMRANAEKICASRSRLRDALHTLGYLVYPSQANFVLARMNGVNQQSMYEWLKTHKILVRYFSAPELADCVRISIGTDDEIDQLLAAMQQFQRRPV
jgi:histidinol-phosphate aminotransferase